ncbi:hypothetical protein E2C01_020164 [Portunus trituberculatus]|uniref:Uncharacterized protein n=1 Tax=Portunus trituberculatus TaxID=210409 RepID=A0A5B7DZ33_PORTR|nr:hypothetical protein [Portunus trituberculatus]
MHPGGDQQQHNHHHHHHSYATPKSDPLLHAEAVPHEPRALNTTTTIFVFCNNLLRETKVWMGGGHDDTQLEDDDVSF